MPTFPRFHRRASDGTLDALLLEDQQRQQERREYWRRRAAVHEAGHATCAWALGVTCEVEITPDSRKRSGCCDGVDLAHLEPHAMLAFKYAAEAAELRQFGDAQLCGDDYRDVEQLARGNQDLLAQGRQWAGDLIARRWNAVERIAGALFEHGRLTGADIEKLLGPSPNALRVRSYAGPDFHRVASLEVCAGDQVVGEIEALEGGTLGFIAYRRRSDCGRAYIGWAPNYCAAARLV